VSLTVVACRPDARLDDLLPPRAIVRTVTRVSTNWPGQSAWSALSNTALARTVPISGSTVLSTKSSVPASGSLRPVTTASTFERERAASSRSCRLPSGTGKLTAIGSSCVTVTSDSVGCTSVPG